MWHRSAVGDALLVAPVIAYLIDVDCLVCVYVLPLHAVLLAWALVINHTYIHSILFAYCLLPIRADLAGLTVFADDHLQPAAHTILLFYGIRYAHMLIIYIYMDPALLLLNRPCIGLLRFRDRLYLPQLQFPNHPTDSHLV